jgi:diaminohydroxyphosphoribosylaminopyrimidine deaminase/5-amino-6-(5-phosphoribosylamino)uracil reductase
MAAALTLARRGLGRVWPNPAVGCIIVGTDGDVTGRGWTQPGGRPHAETEALRRAGDAARGGTAYVSLEPCSHVGETGPCTDALIRAGVRRVVAATEDPDPRVAGKGLEKLRAAGIEVRVGVARIDAERLNAGFFRRVLDGRPFVTAKLATTMDGRVATHGGESKWITGVMARAWGQPRCPDHQLGHRPRRRSRPDLSPAGDGGGLAGARGDGQPAEHAVDVTHRRDGGKASDLAVHLRGSPA